MSLFGGMPVSYRTTLNPNGGLRVNRGGGGLSGGRGSSGFASSGGPPNAYRGIYSRSPTGPILDDFFASLDANGMGNLRPGQDPMAMLEEFNRMFGGGGGGGGGRGGGMDNELAMIFGGGGRGGGGGGGLGKDQTDLMHLLSGQVSQDALSDGGFNARIDALLEELNSTKGKLLELDPQAAADLDTSLAARKNAASQEYDDQQSKMLTQLFGRGVQQSTVAGEAAGRMTDRRVDALSNIDAQGADERLSMRDALTNNFMTNIMNQVGGVEGERQGDLALRGMRAQQLSDIFGNQTQLNVAGMSAAAQRASAAAGLMAARESAGASRFATKYGGGLSFLANQQGMNANSFSDMLSAFMGDRQFGQTLDWDIFSGLEDFGLQDKNIEAQKKMAKDAAAAQKRAALYGALGAATGMFSFSDEGLKTNIVRMAEDALPGVPWSVWDWSDGSGVGVGVIAQDLMAVRPDLVRVGSNGFLQVNYGGF